MFLRQDGGLFGVWGASAPRLTRRLGAPSVLSRGQQLTLSNIFVETCRCLVRRLYLWTKQRCVHLTRGAIREIWPTG